MEYERIINRRVADVPPSGIRRFFDIVQKMPDAISLGVGEPDFVTPWFIRDAAIQSIEDGRTQYTSNWGLLSLRAAGVLVGYQTLINWERTEREFVQAVIEVNVVPQREKGFDAIAQRIVQYDEVKSLYLMSGAYDLMVLCEARTLKELASFVHSRLSTIEGVTGTSTHFMLKTYKYGGMVFDSGKSDRRQAVMP